MAHWAALQGKDNAESIDLPVDDINFLIRIFGRAWEANDLWETDIKATPLPASTILRRMDLLGFTDQDMLSDFNHMRESWLSGLRSLYMTWTSDDYLSEEDKDAAEGLQNLIATNLEVDQLRQRSIENARIVRPLLYYWAEVENEDYPSNSTVTRIALQSFPSESLVYATIPQDYLFAAIPKDVEWHEDKIPLSSSHSLMFRNLAWKNTRPIVLLEGAFDSKVLNAVFEIRFPEYADYLSIADFTQGAEGGASGLVRALRTLAQLAIPNTILGLFDNDAAGREAISALRKVALPANIGFETYPDLQFAKAYPTIGPTGPADADINGKALSIELFLGADCIKEGRDMLPIEWTGLNHRMQVYQGSIINKKLVQKRFEEKVSRTRARAAISTDDWSSLDLLGDFIMHAIAQISAHRGAR